MNIPARNESAGVKPDDLGYRDRKYVRKGRCKPDFKYLFADLFLRNAVFYK